MAATPLNESGAQFSPDGKWIVYEQSDGFLRAFPTSSRPWQVSNHGGWLPKWRADGKELFYVGPDRNRIMAVGVRIAGENVQIDTPRELFPVVALPRRVISPYDVSARTVSASWCCSRA